MSTAEKFMFDMTFDEEPSPVSVPEVEERIPEVEEEPEEIVPTFSEEEIEIARQQGFEAGKQEGLAATTESLTKQINETLTQIDQKLGAAFQNQDSVNEELPRAALSVALGVCKKMLPAMAEKYSFEEVERVLGDIFAKIVEEPSVKISVHSSVAEEIGKRIDDLSSSKGFMGRTTIQIDDSMQKTDCRVEWANGGSERNSSALWREITAVIERNIGDHPTIWDEPENLEEIASEETADLTSPEALVETREAVQEENSPEFENADTRNENQPLSDVLEESPSEELQQTNTDD